VAQESKTAIHCNGIDKWRKELRTLDNPTNDWLLAFGAKPILIRSSHAYQRKSVWGPKKKKALLDSLFRRYYVPRIVIREVRRDHEHTAREVIDGQQRITTAKEFLSDEITLPKSLADIDSSLPGSRYSDLPAELRRFVDRELKYNADIVKGIEDPRNPEHQRIAAEIFWRLQQGETLTFMEIAHSRLSSLSRNFVEKYADDIRFDYQAYEPVDGNPDKHPFFRVIDRTVGPFRVADIQRQCPGVSLDMIRKVLKDLRPRVQCLGRGKEAKWEKTADWELGNN